MQPQDHWAKTVATCRVARGSVYLKMLHTSVPEGSEAEAHTFGVTLASVMSFAFSRVPATTDTLLNQGSVATLALLLKDLQALQLLCAVHRASMRV